MSDPRPTDDQSSFADEENIIRLIESAREGGSAGVVSAWHLIDELERLFSERAAGEHDRLGLDFVRALGEARNRAYDIANKPESSDTPPAFVTGQSPITHTQQLLPALKALGLGQGRLRPRVGNDQVVQRQAAWTRLEAASTAFTTGSPLEQWLAECFKALLAIRDTKGPMVPTKNLIPAFDCMHLVRSNNRHLVNSDDVAAHLAVEELVRRLLAEKRRPVGYKHGDAEAARTIAGEIFNMDPVRLAAIRKQHPEIARYVSPNAGEGHEGSWLSKRELEGLAGMEEGDVEKHMK